MTEKVILLEGVDPVELYGAGNSNIEKISAKFPKLKSSHAVRRSR